MNNLLLVLSLMVHAPGDTDALRRAYQKEFAYLAQEKRSLTEQLESMRRETEQKQSQAEQGLSGLESALRNAESDARQAEETLTKLESQVENRDLDRERLVNLAAQAASANPHANADAGSADTIAMAFAGMLEQVERTRVLRRGKAIYFSADGVQRESEALFVGGIATLTIDGPLVPVGHDRLRVWPDEDATKASRSMLAKTKLDRLSLILHQARSAAMPLPKDQSFTAFMRAGGPVAWVILVLGALAVVLTIARAALLARCRIDDGAWMDSLETQLRSGDALAARDQLSRAHGALGRVVRRIVWHSDRPEAKEDQSVGGDTRLHEALLAEESALSRFGSILQVIAGIAPLLGLLGTVTGMIATFDIITEVGSGDPKLLAGGISEALITTELGLVVAIPVLLIATILNAWAERIRLQLERGGTRVIAALEICTVQRQESVLQIAPRAEAG